MPDPLLSRLTRRRFGAFIFALSIAAGSALAAPSAAQAQNATKILKAAFDNWRANSSHAVTTMTIKHAGSTRKLTMESWTEGSNKALVRFTAPARDAGNATLQIGSATYVFNPRINQVIKLPASAMSQSWMGSDFSYNDLSRSEKIITDFTHKLIGTKTVAGKKIYVIESIPKPGKPIIWGKEVVSVRSDGVLYQIAYYDQLGNRVRVMTADKIARIGGRPYPVVMTMRVDAKPGQYTRLTTDSATFNQPIPAYMFTLSNLQNPRE